MPKLFSQQFGKKIVNNLNLIIFYFRIIFVLRHFLKIIIYKEFKKNYDLLDIYYDKF